MNDGQKREMEGRQNKILLVWKGCSMEHYTILKIKGKL